MKLKRFLALVVALAMVMSAMPAMSLTASAAVAQSVKAAYTYTYNVNYNTLEDNGTTFKNSKGGTSRQGYAVFNIPAELNTAASLNIRLFVTMKEAIGGFNSKTIKLKYYLLKDEVTIDKNNATDYIDSKVEFKDGGEININNGTKGAVFTSEQFSFSPGGAKQIVICIPPDTTTGNSGGEYYNANDGENAPYIIIDNGTSVEAKYMVGDKTIKTERNSYLPETEEGAVFGACAYSANGTNTMYYTEGATLSQDDEIELKPVDNEDVLGGEKTIEVEGVTYRVISDNLIPNGNFQYGLIGWYAGDNSEASSANFTVADNALKQKNAGNTGTAVSIYRAWAVEAGKTYVMKWTMGAETKNSFINTATDASRGNGVITTLCSSMNAGENELVFTADEKAAYVTFNVGWYTDTFSNFGLYEVSDADVIIETKEDLINFRDAVNNGNDYEGKLIKLAADIDLSDVNDGNTGWEPIGSYHSKYEEQQHYFKGTFDGNYHTISGMYMIPHEEAWDYTGHYEGLFGYVNDATIKNLTISGANLISCDYSGLVAAAAYGDCTFENINIKNSEIYVYNCSSAGILGFATGVDGEGKESKITFTNINVDETNKIGALWDTYDSPVGGILGYAYKNCDITMTNCNVAAQLDVFNDVASNYQWWQYRRAGMLIGFLGDDTNPTSVNGNTVTVDSNNISVTFEGCTVTYGTWNQYEYCEWESAGSPSYSQDGEWKFRRTDKMTAHEKEQDGIHISTEEYCHIPIRFYQLWTQGNYYTGFTPGREIEGVTITDLNVDTTKNLATGEGYETVQAALDEAMPGDEIALLMDVQTEETLSVYDNSVAMFALADTDATEGVTLNLMGNTITGVSNDKNFTLIENNGNLIIKDSLGTGALKTIGSDNIVIKNNAGSSLTLNGGDVSGANGIVVEDSENSSLTVTGKSSVTGGVYVLGANSEEESSSTMSIATNSVDNIVYTSEDLTAYVAEIGDVKYESLEAAVNAAVKGDTITLLDTTVLVSDTTLDLENVAMTGNVYPVIRVQNGANVTVKNGNITNGDYVFVLGASDGSSAGNLTIESGKYHGETTVASVTKGTLTITGGEFSVEPYEGSYEYLLNCIDANYKTGEASIVVTGGTFHGFNPAENAAEGADTSFVSTDYRAVDNGDGTWTVAEKASVAQVGAEVYHSLQTAIDAVVSAGEGTVELLADSAENVIIADYAEVTLITDDYTYTGTVTLAEYGAWIIADEEINAVSTVEDIPVVKGANADKTQFGYAAMLIGVDMVNGAQVRIGGGVDDDGKVAGASTNKSGSGIRFITQVNRSDTLAAMADHSGESYTMQEGEYTYHYTNGIIGVLVSAEGSTASTIIAADSWQSEYFFTTAITNLAVSNYVRKFTARGYVDVNGIRYVSNTGVTRSIYQVASGILIKGKVDGDASTDGNHTYNPTEEKLLEVLNAYVNQAGIRLLLVDGELVAHDGLSDASKESSRNGYYGAEAYFEVSKTTTMGDVYKVILTPRGNAKIKTNTVSATGQPFWYEYVRINNNNSSVRTKVTVTDNLDGTYTLEFNAAGIGLEPNDNTTQEDINDVVGTDQDNEEEL